VHDQLTNTLAGPDFLEAYADQQLALGNEINAAEFRRRAAEWRNDIATRDHCDGCSLRSRPSSLASRSQLYGFFGTAALTARKSTRWRASRCSLSAHAPNACARDSCPRVIASSGCPAR
jgi:hypothetical protein